MKYLIMLLVLFPAYYTLSYALHLWKKEKNKLGSVGTIIIVVLGTVWPIIELWIKL